MIPFALLGAVVWMRRGGRAARADANAAAHAERETAAEGRTADPAEPSALTPAVQPA
jgi:hypothetical protein